MSYRTEIADYRKQALQNVKTFLEWLAAAHDQGDEREVRLLRRYVSDWLRLYQNPPVPVPVRRGR